MEKKSINQSPHFKDPLYNNPKLKPIIPPSFPSSPPPFNFPSSSFESKTYQTRRVSSFVTRKKVKICRIIKRHRNQVCVFSLGVGVFWSGGKRMLGWLGWECCVCYMGVRGCGVSLMGFGFRFGAAVSSVVGGSCGRSSRLGGFGW